MKITFIIPKYDSEPGPAQQFAQGRVFPPVALAPMVRLVGKLAGVHVIDERLEATRHANATDIAVIFINNYNQQRARELAIKYQMRGSFVVLTGPNLNLDSLQQGMFANCLFIGSPEDCMRDFLRDYRNAKVMGFYIKHPRKAGAKPVSMTFGTTTLSIAS